MSEPTVIDDMLSSGTPVNLKFTQDDATIEITEQSFPITADPVVVKEIGDFLKDPSTGVNYTSRPSEEELNKLDVSASKDDDLDDEFEEGSEDEEDDELFEEDEDDDEDEDEEDEEQNIEGV